MIAIKNGKIILPDRIDEGKVLLIDEKIEGIVDLQDIPSGVEIIDAEGGYISPGFIDLHIHGYLGCDVCDATEKSLKIISRGLLENGVTGFLPTTMTVDMSIIYEVLDVCRGWMGRDCGGAKILGVHAEGPFISALQKGAQNERYVLKPDADFVIKNSDVLRIITLAPEEDRNFETIKSICQATDVKVSMGHTAASYDEAVEGIAAGVSHATHLFNRMTPLSHRTPGAVGAALSTDISCELIVDNYHIHPSLYNIVYKLKGRKLCFITDCLPAGGLGEGEYTLGGTEIVYRDGICYLKDGTIAGSVLKLNKGVWNVYNNSDIPLYECVNCASLNPASVLGISDRKGSLEIGKDADIVVLDEQFEANMTIIGGVVKYKR